MRRLACVVVLAAAGVCLAQEPAPKLRVHLPRTATAPAGVIGLGQVCAVVCDDQALAAKASKVELGRAPTARETIVVDRNTIASRLASCGIDAKAVEFSGAAKVAVEPADQTVAAADVLRAAAAFLAKHGPGPDGCSWKLAGEPDLSGINGLTDTFEPRLSASSSPSQIKIELTALRDKKPAGTVTLVYKAVWPTRRAVATRDIAAGATLTVDNVKIEDALAEQKPAVAWVNPVGMPAASAIAAGATITPAMVKPAGQPLVHKDQGVTMRVAGLGFRITAQGRALENGRIGDIIKVRNVDSDRVVLARVAPDGAVEPTGAQENK